MKYRSLIGGAFGDAGFEVGDLIDVPDNKVDEWLDAGLIVPLPKSQTRRIVVIGEGDE